MALHAVFLVILAQCVFIPPAWTAEAWALAKEVDDIKLYTRKADDTPIKEVKATMVIDATIGDVTELIMDVKAIPQWMYGIEESYVIKSEGKHSVWVRNVVSLPWPIQDRDNINQMRVTTNSATSLVTIEMINHPDEIPPVEGIVRMPVAQGSWELRPLEDGRVEVSQQYKADPGGTLPEWVINMFVLEGPISTFKSMRQMLYKREPQTFNPGSSSSQ
jgi:hypothetical protein